MDSKDGLAFGGAKRDIILLHATDLRDLHEVAEFVRLAVQVGNCFRHVLILHKEL